MICFTMEFQKQNEQVEKKNRDGTIHLIKKNDHILQGLKG